MPRTRLDKYSKPQLPEVDLLKAFILERMAITGHKVSFDALAVKSGISCANLRRLMAEDTGNWKKEQRAAVCKALGLDEGRISATAYYYDNLPKLFCN